MTPMTQAAQALFKFFSSFGLDAYTEDHVPEGAKLPYITYPLILTEPDEPRLLPVRIWYRGDSFAPISAKIDEVMTATKGGKCVPTAHGFLWINSGEVQFQPIDNPDIRVAYINLQIHSFIF